MTVGRWRCDILETDGKRQATVLKDGKEIKTQLIWIDGKDRSGLVFKVNDPGGTEAVPAEVVDWLRTGNQEITDDFLDEALKG